jgi:bifunctional DNA primase/polymerase-like protein
MAKKVKRTKRMKAGDKRREKVRSNAPNREHRRGNRKSGSNNTRLEVALLCASAGLPVVPLHGVKGGRCTCGNKQCEQPGRHPRTKRAITDRALIKKCWTKLPKAKIGIVLGTASGVVALVAEGSNGKKTLSALEEKHNEANGYHR